MCRYTAYLDSGGGQAANEGDAVEAHSPEEGRTGGLHHEVLQENPQLREEGPDQRETAKNKWINPLHVHAHVEMNE